MNVQLWLTLGAYVPMSFVYVCICVCVFLSSKCVCLSPEVSVATCTPELE